MDASKPERTLGEKLKDANAALRGARQELGRAIQQRDHANSFVASRRVKVDQLETWTATLQALFDAEARLNEAARNDQDHDSSKEDRFMPQQIVRVPKVCRRLQISRSALYRLIDRGEFPAPFKISAQCVGWRESDIDRWIESRQAIQQRSAAVVEMQA